MIKELLPDIAFCETDTAKVEAALIAEYERITDRQLYPGNPERLFIEAVAYLISQQRFMIDYAGKMNLVSLSAGNYLDHLGAFLSTARLGMAYAKTSLRFTLSAAIAWDVAIPAGTRASADGKLFFATGEAAVCAAGQTHVDVPATCVEPGTLGNGLVPSQINRLIDRITYVAGVTNLYLTLGGTDAEADERFRGRVQLAPERLSCCGPEGAYRYHAMSVSPDIADVAVWNPEPGQIRVAPLMAGGAAPTAKIITAINAALTPEKIRPMTDGVQVVVPEMAHYSVAATFYVKTSYASVAGEIQAKAAAALAGYLDWQKAKLGRDITPSELVSRVQAIEGVQRVVLTAPDYQALDPWQAAQNITAELTYGGLSDD